jgi:hypothetical protein
MLRQEQEAKQNRLPPPRPQLRGYTLPFVELPFFLNDLVIDSPYICRARLEATMSTTLEGGHLTRKRPNGDPLVEASKHWQRGEGLGLGRGRGRGNDRGGRGGGRGRPSPITVRIDFNAIVGASTSSR